MKELTAEQKQAYLEDDNICPLCGSDKLETSDFQAVVGQQVHQSVLCLSCEAQWYDIYALKDIELRG